MNSESEVLSSDRLNSGIIHEEIKHQVSSVLRDEIKVKILGAAEEKKSSATALSHKSDKIVKILLNLFKTIFDEEQCHQLGIEIKEIAGGWFTSGSIDITVHCSEEVKIGGGMQCSTQLPQLLDNLVSQYLTEKHERRAEDSFLSVNYKSFTARLINKIVNAIYNRKLTRQEQIFYLENVDEFISLIRQEDILFATEQAQEATQLHFEGFLLEAQQKINSAVIELRTSTDAHQLHTWLTEWQLKIGEILRGSVPWIHCIIQTKSIPKNISDQLQKLGSAYQRQLEAHISKSFEGCINFKQDRLIHYQKIKESTRIQLNKFYSDKEISQTLLIDAVNQKIISWEQYYFYNLDSEYYSADQLLWELLHYPEALPLSKTAVKNQLCYTKVLNLYRSFDEAEQHNLFLLLTADLQLSYFPAPRLIRRCEEAEIESTETLITELSELMNVDFIFGSQKFMQLQWRFGIIKEIFSLISESECQQMTRIIELLNLIQQCQLKFSYVWNLLELYRKLLPSTGELIGGIALSPHLESCAELIYESGRKLQACIFELNQLVRYGNHLPDAKQDGLQTILLQHPISKFYRVKNQNIRYWLKSENLRYRQGTQLSIMVEYSIRLAKEFSQHCSPGIFIDQAKMSERLFSIADRLSIPVLSKSAQHSRLKSQAVMHQFDSLVSSSIVLSHTSHSLDVTKNLEIKEEKNLKPILEIKASKNLSKVHVTTLEKFLRDLANLSLKLLDNDPKVEDSIIQNKLNELINHHQEKFFEAFSQVYALLPPREWMAFFYLKIGFLYYPLPKLENPSWFKWWYRHSIADRNLFFRSLCTAYITEDVKQKAQTAIVYQRYQQFIFQEQARYFHEQSRYSNWFDRFRCHIKNKFILWGIHLTQTIHETKSIFSDKEIKREIPQEKIILNEIKKISEVKETKVPVKKIVEIAEPTAGDESKLTLPLTSPIDLIPESTEWINYHDILMESSDNQKKIYCLLFFKTALFKIEQNQLSIAKNIEHAKQCHLLIVLFQKAIKSTSLYTSLLGISLESLDETFKEKTSIVKHKFFVQTGTRLLEKYKEELLFTEPSSLSAPVL